MASGIYAIANIGRLKVFIGDIHSIQLNWPRMLEMLNSGKYPHAALQQEWQKVGQHRHFTFHTHKEIAGDREIIGIEQLER
ncbi:hypothetical protein NIES2100_41460 [Calothrix sp. NIES-2100]|uniref:hypothetical protein n=1 Tax=Calothrix sp. NIES-2100 TaxID=1954172 RepID=UPI000B60862E|nr:hypothetical protein NIES2100_41460 [Calothrix sp. NIES-2100]